MTSHGQPRGGMHPGGAEHVPTRCGGESDLRGTKGREKREEDADLTQAEGGCL